MLSTLQGRAVLLWYRLRDRYHLLDGGHKATASFAIFLIVAALFLIIEVSISTLSLILHLEYLFLCLGIIQYITWRYIAPLSDRLQRLEGGHSTPREIVVTSSTVMTPPLAPTSRPTVDREALRGIEDSINEVATTATHQCKVLEADLNRKLADVSTPLKHVGDRISLIEKQASVIASLESRLEFVETRIPDTAKIEKSMAEVEQSLSELYATVEKATIEHETTPRSGVQVNDQGLGGHDHASRIHSLENDVSDLSAECERLAKAIHVSGKVAASVEESVRELTIRCDCLETAANSYGTKDELVALQEDLEGVKRYADVHSPTEEVRLLLSSVGSQQDQLRDELTTRYSTLFAEHHQNTTREIATLSSDIVSLRDFINSEKHVEKNREGIVSDGLSTLRGDFDTLRLELVDVTKICANKLSRDDVESLLTALKEGLEERSSEMVSMNAALSLLKTTQRDSQQHYASLRAEFQSLVSSDAAKAFDVETFRTSLLELEDEVVILRRKAEATPGASLEALVALMTDMQGLRNEVTTRSSILEGDLADWKKASAEQVSRETCGLAASVSALENALGDVVTQRNQQEIKFAELLEAVDQKTAVQPPSLEAFAALTADMQGLRNEVTTRSSVLEGDLADWKKASAEQVSREICGLAASVSALEDALGNLVTQHKQEEIKVAELREAVADKTAIQSLALEAVAALTTDIQGLRNEVAVLEGDSADWKKASVEHVSREIRRLEDALNDVVLQQQQGERNASEFKQQLSEVSQRTQSVVGQLSDIAVVGRAVTALSHQMESLSVQVDKTVLDVNNTAEKVGSLALQVEDSTVAASVGALTQRLEEGLATQNALSDKVEKITKGMKVWRDDYRGLKESVSAMSETPTKQVRPDTSDTGSSELRTELERLSSQVRIVASQVEESVSTIKLLSEGLSEVGNGVRAIDGMSYRISALEGTAANFQVTKAETAKVDDLAKMIVNVEKGALSATELTQSRVKELTNGLESLQAELKADLNAVIQSTQQVVKTVASAAEQDRTSIKTLSLTVQDLEHEVRQMQDIPRNIAALEDALGDMSMQVNTVDAKSQALSLTIQGVDKEVKGSSDTVAELGRRLQDSLMSQEALNEKLKKIMTGMKSWKEEFVGLKESVTTLYETPTKRPMEDEPVAESIKALTDDVAKLQEQIKNTVLVGQGVLEETILQLQEEVRAISKASSARNDTVTALDENVAQLDKVFRASQLMQQDAETEKLKQMMCLQEEVHTLVVPLREVSARLESAEKSLQQLQEETKCMSSLPSTVREVYQKVDALTATTANVNSTATEVALLQQDIRNSTNVTASLEGMVAQIIKDNKSLSEELKKQTSVFHEGIHGMESTTNALESKLAELGTEVAHVNARGLSFEKTIAQLAVDRPLHHEVLQRTAMHDETIINIKEVMKALEVAFSEVQARVNVNEQILTESMRGLDGLPPRVESIEKCVSEHSKTYQGVQPELLEEFEVLKRTAVREETLTELLSEVRKSLAIELSDLKTTIPQLSAEFAEVKASLAESNEKSEGRMKEMIAESHVTADMLRRQQAEIDTLTRAVTAEEVMTQLQEDMMCLTARASEIEAHLNQLLELPSKIEELSLTKVNESSSEEQTVFFLSLQEELRVTTKSVAVLADSIEALKKIASKLSEENEAAKDLPGRMEALQGEFTTMKNNTLLETAFSDLLARVSSMEKALRTDFEEQMDALTATAAEIRGTCENAFQILRQSEDKTNESLAALTDSYNAYVEESNGVTADFTERLDRVNSGLRSWREDYKTVKDSVTSLVEQASARSTALAGTVSDDALLEADRGDHMRQYKEDVAAALEKLKLEAREFTAAEISVLSERIESLAKSLVEANLTTSNEIGMMMSEMSDHLVTLTTSVTKAARPDMSSEGGEPEEENGKIEPSTEKTEPATLEATTTASDPSALLPTQQTPRRWWPFTGGPKPGTPIPETPRKTIETSADESTLAAQGTATPVPTERKEDRANTTGSAASATAHTPSVKQGSWFGSFRRGGGDSADKTKKSQHKKIILDDDKPEWDPVANRWVIKGVEKTAEEIEQERRMKEGPPKSIAIIKGSPPTTSGSLSSSGGAGKPPGPTVPGLTLPSRAVSSEDVALRYVDQFNS